MMSEIPRSSSEKMVGQLDRITAVFTKIARPTLFVVLAAVAVLIGWRAKSFSALSDYFLFTAEYAQNNLSLRLIFQLLLVAGLYVIFALFFYRRIISPLNPIRALSAFGYKIEGIARLVILIVPSAVIGYLLYAAGSSATGRSWVIWCAAAIVFITATCQTFLAAATIRTERTAPPTTPEQKLMQFALFISLPWLVAVGLYIWIWIDVIGATFFMGGIGIILLFLIFLLFVFEFLELYNLSPEIIAVLVAAVLVWQFAGPPQLEFVHTNFSGSNAKADTPERVEDAIQTRKLPTLSTAFHGWLDKRFPSEKRGVPGHRYPVFIVAAQGGGLYAAYHTALSLARLYDACPKLKDHVFAISGVSGGSFGAAMLSEALRSNQNELGDTCSDQPNRTSKLENSVNGFFEFDFVTPVIATGLLFDLPTALYPPMRLTHDRARTLELAFNNALHFALNSDAPPTEFYSSWTDSGVTPALFFNTTNTNYGRPTLLSQLYMVDEHSDAAFSAVSDYVLQKFGTDTADNEQSKKALREMVESGVRANAYSRPAYFNILQYRSDLQLPLATAAVLSARFPFVTPPGVIYPSAKNAATDATMRETKALQLIDGGFSDNSGISTAIEIVKQLRASLAAKDLESKIEFHLISFGHSNAALQRAGEREAQPEFIAPLTTFETVREAHSLNEADAKKAGFDVVHGYQLFDHEFQAPLSWTLSGSVRSQIEARSGGNHVKPVVCCSLALPEALRDKVPDLIIDVKHFKDLPANFSANPEQFGLNWIAPNVRQFRAVIKTVQANSDRLSTASK